MTAMITFDIIRQSAAIDADEMNMVKRCVCRLYYLTATSVYCEVFNTLLMTCCRTVVGLTLSITVNMLN